ncbi:MAG: TIGR00730 family Rossman fold protein [Proteobacteria bacterium]|nr:TIGR00730 family Rossman fold protein [Pseudomonadota bacterium]MBU1714341.1 TIGR00730 family Rossman fold protein [Pseudomonadota bacterium]
MAKPPLHTCFPNAHEDAARSTRFVESAQTRSKSYMLAYNDPEFMMSDALRPVRLQLELLKPELVQQEHDIQATVVIFGGTRVPEEHIARERLVEAENRAAEDPNSETCRCRIKSAQRVLAKAHYYEEARKLGRMLSEVCLVGLGCNLVVLTGGGPGIMEAANRGAHDAGAKTMGLNIVLPHEQEPNPYITPELCFQFHYFSIRKMHFLMRAQALVAFPGGFGTLDELFETLTLIQTKKIKPLPVLLFGRKFWEKAINFEFLLEEGVIDPDDLNIFRYVETAEEATRIILESTTDSLEKPGF